MLQTNTFQLVLATDSLRSFALFLYLDDGIEWPSELFQANAVSGYNAGDGINYYQHPLSFNFTIGSIEETNDVGVDGLYIFQVDGSFTGKNLYLLKVYLILVVCRISANSHISCCGGVVTVLLDVVVCCLFMASTHWDLLPAEHCLATYT